MTSKEKVLQVYPNAWSQRGIGTATRGYVWAGDGSTRKLVDMDKTRLRESELWSGAWRRIEEQKNRQAAALAAQKDEMENLPKIVCLCGSTRFKDAFEEANYRETMAGRIVLSVGFMMHATGNKHGEEIGASPEQKIGLDELHKRKIDLCDEVFVLDVDGYIGSSTRSEIDYAIAHGKPVAYLSQTGFRDSVNTQPSSEYVCEIASIAITRQ